MTGATIYRSVSLLLLSLLPGLISLNAQAHESRPLYVEIVERTETAYSVNWRIPPSAFNVAAPYIGMPDGCQAQTKPRGSNNLKQQFFRCQGELSNTTLTINWPEYNPSISTLLRFERLSGEMHSTILGPDTMQWQVPNREDGLPIAGEYLILGVEHILFGFDHLLFVACLVFIAGSIKRILLTVTGFTLSHSLTLVLAALEVVNVPIVAVETIIALSIVFLATEIARAYAASPTARRNTLTWRYPVLVASTFGLLHGFGFASVLTEIGLPQTELPIALLFFNLGVELGQIVFILALIAIFMVFLKAGLRNRNADPCDTGVTNNSASNNGSSNNGAATLDMPAIEQIPRPLLLATIYSIGLLASYWMFDRLINGLF